MCGACPAAHDHAAPGPALALAAQQPYRAVLLALAGALLLAQTISAALLYKAQAEYQDEG
jgi:predicted secreted protein